MLAAALVLAVLVPPLLPRVVVAGDGATPIPRFAGTRLSRARLAAKRRLYAAIAGQPQAPAVRRSALPPPPALEKTDGATTRRALSAGFYVNWDDNSLVSLKAHASRLDWVICEWGFITSDGRSIQLRIDRRVLYLMHQLPVASRPSVMLMLSNYDSTRQNFDPARLRSLTASPAARTAIVAKLLDVVSRYGLGGVTADFEEVPPGLERNVDDFVRQIGDAMHTIGAVVSTAVAAESNPTQLRAAAASAEPLTL